MSKFTKGPWRCNDGTKIGIEELFVDVAMVGVVCRLTKQVDTHIPLSDEDIANAHLITAAPDMYAMINDINESIINCKNEIDLADDITNLCHDIDQLLKKARGESL